MSLLRKEAVVIEQIDNGLSDILLTHQRLADKHRVDLCIRQLLYISGRKNATFGYHADVARHLFLQSNDMLKLYGECMQVPVVDPD